MHPPRLIPLNTVLVINMNSKLISNYLNCFEALLALLKDTESFDKLSKWTNQLNIFDILKISKMEIRHSNMLGWLLDPNESHGLGAAFLYGFFIKLSNTVDSATALKMLTQDLSSFMVFRERYNIDILLVSSESKIVLAIENKIGSNEHKAGKEELSQLEKYKKVIEEKYSDFTQLRVYLTPEGDIPSVEDWLIMSYSDILDILQSVYSSRSTQLSPEADVLISNYIFIIKKEVIMDNELIKLCNEIYNKHKVALDLIYENKDDKASQTCLIAKEVLKKYQDIEVDKKNNKSCVRFWTKTLKDTFVNYVNDSLKEYYYQVLIRNNKVILELAFHRNKSSNKKGLYNTINNYPVRGNEIKEDWEWLRRWSVSLDIFEEFSDSLIENWLKNKINEILEKEKRLVMMNPPIQ